MHLFKKNFKKMNQSIKLTLIFGLSSANISKPSLTTNKPIEYSLIIEFGLITYDLNNVLNKTMNPASK